MSKHVLVVLSKPTEGKAEEYQEWYNNQHLDEVLRIPGFVAATRYELSEHQLEGFTESQHPYLAIYEIDGDPQEALERLHKQVESGEIVLPDAIDVSSIAPWCFSPIIERKVAAS